MECELLQKTAVKRPSHSMLEALEHAAAEVARDAGSHIVAVPRDRLDFHLKQPPAGMAANANPVSNVDCEVEQAIRRRIRTMFPDHVVLGEETDDDPDTHESAFVWVIDPIDGTTNYLNGLPLYCSSIGVLFRNFPVAGAVWCASSHALRAGVYHAHEDGPLRFDGEKLAPRSAGAWRGIASEPGAPAHYGAFFDTRVLASAALECAFTSAGLLRLAYLQRPAIWDIAAGIVLARAAGCDVLTRRHNAWSAFTGFTALNAKRRLSTLRSWRQPVLIGDRRAVTREAAVDTAIE
jgi:myo-inositol-1(or 4)-monophosphatase